MQIEVQNVRVYREGKYEKMELAYVRDGKSEKRKLVNAFESKDTFAALQNARGGEIFDVDTVKNEESGYWEWKGATKSAATAAKTAYATKGTYETPVERAQKQVRIARQSSLSNAVHFLATKPETSKDQVLSLAQEFVDFVMKDTRLDEAFVDDVDALRN